MVHISRFRPVLSLSCILFTTCDIICYHFNQRSISFTVRMVPTVSLCTCLFDFIYFPYGSISICFYSICIWEHFSYRSCHTCTTAKQCNQSALFREYRITIPLKSPHRQSSEQKTVWVARHKVSRLFSSFSFNKNCVADGADLFNRFFVSFLQRRVNIPE